MRATTEELSSQAAQWVTAAATTAAVARAFAAREYIQSQRPESTLASLAIRHYGLHSSVRVLYRLRAVRMRDDLRRR